MTKKLRAKNWRLPEHLNFRKVKGHPTALDHHSCWNCGDSTKLVPNSEESQRWIENHSLCLEFDREKFHV